MALPPGRLQVWTQQGLPSGQHDDEILRPVVSGNDVERPQEVLQRHILFPAEHGSVASAMAAVQVAADRTFPEEGVQLVDCHFVVAEKAEGKRIHIFCKYTI